MPARDKMGSYNLCREEGSMGFLFTSLTECCDNIMNYLFPVFMCGSLLVKLTFNSEAHAFLFAVISATIRQGREEEMAFWLISVWVLLWSDPE